MKREVKVQVTQGKETNDTIREGVRYEMMTGEQVLHAASYNHTTSLYTMATYCGWVDIASHSLQGLECCLAG